MPVVVEEAADPCAGKAQRLGFKVEVQRQLLLVAATLSRMGEAGRRALPELDCEGWSATADRASSAVTPSQTQRSGSPSARSLQPR